MASKDEFSDSQRAALESLARERGALLAEAEDRKHRKWLGELLKRWATWISAIILGAGAVWDLLTRIIKAITEHQK